MAKKTIYAQMKQRRDTKANWEATNPVLLDGEIGIVTDDPNLYKVGNGSSRWNSLPFRGFDGTVVHETGDSTTAVMSQAAVSAELQTLSETIDTNKTETDTKLTELESETNTKISDLKSETNNQNAELKTEIGVFVSTSHLSQSSDMYNYVRVPFKQGDKVVVSNQSDGAMNRNMLIFDEQGNTNIAIPLNSQDVEITIPRDTTYIALYAFKGGVTQEGEVILTVKPISGLEYRVSHLESETDKINNSIEDIKSDLSDVNDRASISYVETEKNIEYTEGKYIDKNGAVFDNASYKYSAPIYLQKGEVIEANVVAASGVVSVITECDADGNNRVAKIVADTTSRKIYRYFATENIYIIVSGAPKFEVKVFSSFTNSSLISHIDSALENDNKTSDEKRAGISALRINITDGIFVNVSGEELSNPAFSLTDYIAVNEGGKLKFVNCINTVDSGVAVSFYDKDRIFRGRVATINYPIDELIAVDIPNGISYARINFRTAKKRSFYCYVDHVYSIEKNASDLLEVVEAFPYNYTIEDGYFISSSDGDVVQNADYSISEYIPIVSNVLSYRGMLFENTAYALYDSEKNVVGLLTTNSSSVIEVAGEIDIIKDCPTAVYLRVTYRPAYDYKPIIRHKGSRIPVPFVHDEESNYISGWKDNCYINGNGKEVSYNGFFASEKVFLKPNATYYHSGLYDGYYAFYDIKGNVIESHGINEPIPNPFITPVGTSYARFTCVNEDLKNKAWIYTEKIVPNPYRNTISEKFLPLRLQNKSFCDFDGNDISLFNRGICVGDSLTQGTMNYEKEDASTGYINMSQYAYPTYLQKLTNIEIVNEGIGGTTSFEWFELKKDADLSGFDFAIIQMGVNDAIRNMSNYGTSWSEDSRQGFSNIINKLKTENPKIKIFVSTIIPAISYSSQQYVDICEYIRDYVSDLADNNVILLDMQIHGNTKDSVAYNCGHLSAYGYWRLAKDYQSIISYYINTHKEEFREVQFIGTDYHYS